MKKLIIAAAIVCAATMSQAAKFQWSASGLVGTDDKTALSSDYLGFGFFKSGDNVTTYTVEQAIAMVMSNTFPESLMELAGVAEGQTLTAGYPFDATGATSGNYEGFMILVNATYTDFDGGKYAPTMYSVIEGGDTAIQKVESAGQAVTFRFAAEQQGAWQSVPEPTSGLLLLLGVAGLALRRRRA